MALDFVVWQIVADVGSFGIEGLWVSLEVEPLADGAQVPWPPLTLADMDYWPGGCAAGRF